MTTWDTYKRSELINQKNVDSDVDKYHRNCTTLKMQKR